MVMYILETAEIMSCLAVHKEKTMPSLLRVCGMTVVRMSG